MRIDIIDRFETEGRGTVFTCHLPELREYKEACGLINQVFAYKGEAFQIKDVEMSRGGIVDKPNTKKWFGLLVKQLKHTTGCTCACHFIDGIFHDRNCCR